MTSKPNRFRPGTLLRHPGWEKLTLVHEHERNDDFIDRTECGYWNSISKRKELMEGFTERFQPIPFKQFLYWQDVTGRWKVGFHMAIYYKWMIIPFWSLLFVSLVAQAVRGEWDVFVWLAPFFAVSVGGAAWFHWRNYRAMCNSENKAWRP